MKSIRPLSALLVCAVLSGHAAGALAATDLTLTAPTDAVPSGSRSFFTVTSSTPGFLNMTLSNASGTEVRVVFLEMLRAVLAARCLMLKLPKPRK